MNNSNSVTMDLENLQKKYSNTLIKYRQASSNYVNYLNSQTKNKNPCSKFSPDKKGVDQKCLDYIWSQNGCTTKDQLTTDSIMGKFLSPLDLISWSYFISTSPAPLSRETCYDKSTTKYSKATEPKYEIIRQPLVTVNNASYLGTGTIGETTANNVQECKVQCASNLKCTGATFISGKCQLRTGDSNIIPTKNSVAIVPKGKQLLMVMNNLNQELININNQIRNKINTGFPIYKDVDNNNNIKSQELTKQYLALNKERNKINHLLDKYDKIHLAQDENLSRLNQNYYTYILLFIIVCFFLFLIIKLSYSGSAPPQYGGQLGDKRYYMVFILIIICTIIYYANKQNI